MLTHQEAETLISARQDAPLSTILEQELQRHLDSCAECRSFAVATERLTAGLQSLPVGPASPKVRREVQNRTRGGRNPLAGLFVGMNLQPGPAFASIAAVLLIAMIGWFAVDRLILTDDPDQEHLSPAPTVPVGQALFATQTATTEAALPTETTVPTETVAPTEVPPTATTVPTDVPPTETAVPTDVAPTETAVPTDVPPTETAVPTDVPPTETPAPTDVPPTATTVPTDAAEAPVDLTGEDAPATQVATATTEPAATATETSVPTASPEPTVTAEATATPTEIADETPEPTGTPLETPEPTDPPGMIEPIDGEVSTVEADGDDAVDAATEVPADQAATETPPIESVDDEPVDLTDADGSDAESTQPVIEQIGEDGENAEAVATADATEAPTEEAETPAADDAETTSLTNASEGYQSIAGDPAGMLSLTREGRLEFVNVPDAANMTTYDGYRLAIADTQPGVVMACTDGDCQPTSEPPAAEGWQGDTPLGVVEGQAYYLRHFADRTEVYVASVSGTSFGEPQLLTETGPSSPPAAVWESDGSLYTWLDSGTWIRLGGGGATTMSGSYANPSTVRFAPRSNPPLMGYFSGGTLVIATTDAPDQPVLTVASDGVDFDIAPGGDRIAVIQGGNIVIMDLDGNVLQVYEAGDATPGSLIWLNGGIVYVDRNTGQLYQIPETGQ